MISDKLHAIFSIKPKYAALIFSGKKTVELRRQIPKQIERGSIILIWVSAPKKQLKGIVKIKSIEKFPLDQMWSRISCYAGITREEFDEYFSGLEEGYVIYLTNPKEFNDGPCLKTLRRQFGFSPPQSYRYIKVSEHNYFTQLLSNSNKSRQTV